MDGVDHLLGPLEGEAAGLDQDDVGPEGPERLGAVWQMPATGIEDAVSELKRAKEKGAKAVGLGTWPSGEFTLSKEDDQFWAVAEELELPIQIHIGLTPPTVKTKRVGVAKGGPEQLVAFSTTMSRMPVLFAEFIFTGVFERFPRLRAFLDDPRVGIEIADGRHALELDERRYDLIEADALWPWSAYSGNLYSSEFFDLCARRLKPAGVVCTWAPTPRIAETFARVFPQAIDVGGILVGSLDPLPFDVAGWTRRAESPEVRDYLGRHATRGLLRSLRGARRLTPQRGASVNRDLNPRDEFATP